WLNGDVFGRTQVIDATCRIGCGSRVAGNAAVALDRHDAGAAIPDAATAGYGGLVLRRHLTAVGQDQGRVVVDAAAALRLIAGHAAAVERHQAVGVGDAAAVGRL